MAEKPYRLLLSDGACGVGVNCAN